ncbi:MAG: hypothetical protein WGN25_14590 [Candidatus Electrothrix sp. GW3-4]|uniref:hypothetical protein n=1 Tax=Candidatus Electrothrix sp. GW3-4 TaxID=3126740 RepID=UPI0030D30C14
MLQVKKNIFAKTALLSALSVCIGLTGKAWALEITLPSSIHDVLTSEQIETVKADPALLAIRNGMRGQVITEQVAKKPAAKMVMSGVLGGVVDKEVSGRFQIGNGTAQMGAASDPDNQE